MSAQSSSSFDSLKDATQFVNFFYDRFVNEFKSICPAGVELKSLSWAIKAPMQCLVGIVQPTGIAEITAALPILRNDQLHYEQDAKLVRQKIASAFAQWSEDTAIDVQINYIKLEYHKDQDDDEIVRECVNSLRAGSMVLVCKKERNSGFVVIRDTSTFARKTLRKIESMLQEAEFYCKEELATSCLMTLLGYFSDRVSDAFDSYEKNMDKAKHESVPIRNSIALHASSSRSTQIYETLQCILLLIIAKKAVSAHAAVDVYSFECKIVKPHFRALCDMLEEGNPPFITNDGKPSRLGI